jgi:hypothetical protein
VTLRSADIVHHVGYEIVFSYVTIVAPFANELGEIKGVDVNQAGVRCQLLDVY